ncbi:MAG: hypothetical protein AAF557_08285 [Pseudomonadota bacterium]
MIQAFIATFPPRRQVFEQALQSIAPQVDRVVAVLNEYDAIPNDLPKYSNVEYFVPDQDLKDVGKFLIRPDDDDEVFLIDDDILYPGTYVDHMRRIGSGVGMDQSVLGMQGHLFVRNRKKQTFTWNNILFHKGQDQILGADYLGTGTVYALGKNIADLAYMTGSQCFVDIRYATWLFDRGIQCWIAPRPEGFLKNILPEDLKLTSVYETFTRHNGKMLSQQTLSFILRSRHVGKVYRDVNE